MQAPRAAASNAGIANPLTQQELESRLWAAADSLRGPVDPADFKAYIFPLLFFKWISDTWDMEHQEAVGVYGLEVRDEEEADWFACSVRDRREGGRYECSQSSTPDWHSLRPPIAKPLCGSSSDQCKSALPTFTTPVMMSTAKAGHAIA